MVPKKRNHSDLDEHVKMPDKMHHVEFLENISMNFQQISPKLTLTNNIPDSSSNTKKKRPSSSVSLLTPEQRKENHINSENRRRAQIRSCFDELVKIVPDIDSTENRSELAILTKTANYIERLRSENAQLEKLRKGHDS